MGKILKRLQVLDNYRNDLNFRTDRFRQTVQTHIRLLLEEQSDQGLHCLLLHLHVFDKIPSGLASLFEILGELQQSFLRLKILELYGSGVHHCAMGLLKRSKYGYE